MERMFSARLVEPVKIDNEWKPTGATILVSQSVITQLDDSRAIDRLSLALILDPDTDPEAMPATNVLLIEQAVAARVEIIQADADLRISKAEKDADLRASNAEKAAASKIALIEAAAATRIAAVEKDAETRIAASTPPPDAEKPPVKSKPK